MRRFAKPLYGLTPVPRVRIPASPPRSLNCRESPPHFPPKYAKHAHFSRLFLSEPDCGERTAQMRTEALSRLFSAGHMSSPVSWKAYGEWNAIR